MAKGIKEKIFDKLSYNVGLKLNRGEEISQEGQNLINEAKKLVELNGIGAPNWAKDLYEIYLSVQPQNPEPHYDVAVEDYKSEEKHTERLPINENLEMRDEVKIEKVTEYFAIERNPVVDIDQKSDSQIVTQQILKDKEPVQKLQDIKIDTNVGSSFFVLNDLEPLPANDLDVSEEMVGEIINTNDFIDFSSYE